MTKNKLSILETAKKCFRKLSVNSLEATYTTKNCELAMPGK
jgi:hypothetical protein